MERDPSASRPTTPSDASASGHPARAALQGAQSAPASRLHLEESCWFPSSDPWEAGRAALLHAARELGPAWAVLPRGATAPERGAALLPGREVALEPGVLLLDWEPFVDGLPIAGAGLRLELWRAGSGWSAERLSGPHWREPRVRGGLDPTLGAVLAASHPGLELPGCRAPTTARAVLEPCFDGTLRAVWEVRRLAALDDPRRLLFDGVTGEPLASHPLGCANRVRGLSWERNPREGPRRALPIPDVWVEQGAVRALTSADGGHGLEGTVTLRLDGPAFRAFGIRNGRVFGPELTLAYAGPADALLLPGPGDEATPFQDQLTAFTNLNRFRARLRRRFPALAPFTSSKLAVLAPWSSNAAYFPYPIELDGEPFPRGYLTFGTDQPPGLGDVSLARDHQVACHEYVHAWSYQVEPSLYAMGLFTPPESAAIFEGIADYFACLDTDTPIYGEHYTGPLRRDLSGASGLKQAAEEGAEPHRLGLVFSQAVWRAGLAAEAFTPGARREVEDAVTMGILRLPPRASFQEAREAILAADTAATGGANHVELARSFHEHGIGSAPGRPPRISAPLRATVRAGERLELEATVRSRTGRTPRVSILGATLPELITSIESRGDAVAVRLRLDPAASAPGLHRIELVAADLESASRTIELSIEAPLAPPLSFEPLPGPGALAPGSLAVVTGGRFGAARVQATPPWPSTLGEVDGELADAAGRIHPLELLAVEPERLVLRLSPEAAPGPADLVLRTPGADRRGSLVLLSAAPALFVHPGRAPRATLLRVAPDGARIEEVLRADDPSFSLGLDTVYLTLYVTGLGRESQPLTVRVGDHPLTPTFAGPQPTFPGLEQVTVLLPAELAGLGEVELRLERGGARSNPARVVLR